jgi:hypothetical protein
MKACVFFLAFVASCGGARATMSDVEALRRVDAGTAFPRGSWDAQTHCGREPSQSRSVCGERGSAICYRDGSRWRWGWSCRPEPRR